MLTNTEADRTARGQIQASPGRPAATKQARKQPQKTQAVQPTPQQQRSPQRVPTAPGAGASGGPPPIPGGGGPPPVPGGGGGPPPVPGHGPQPSYMGAQPPAFQAQQTHAQHVQEQTGVNLSNVAHQAVGRPPAIPQQKRFDPMAMLQASQAAGAQRAAQEEAQRQRAQLVQKPKALPNSGLMAALRGGAQLKKTTGPVQREKPKDSRSLLMQSLAKGGNQLKHVDHEQIEAAKPKEPQNANIFAILQRRNLIGGDSSSEEDTDSGWSDSE